MVSQRISKVPYSIGINLRYSFYKRHLTSVGENVIFSYGTILTCPDISIGNNVRFGPYNTIALVDIGSNFLSGQFVHLMSGSQQHSFLRTDVPINKQPGTLTRIVIQDDVWIGVNSVIMANIGSGSVIGASSVVVKNIDNFSVAVGNPARIIKNRLG